MATRSLQVAILSISLVLVVLCAARIVFRDQDRFTYQQRWFLKLAQAALSFVWLAGGVITTAGGSENLSQNTAYVILSLFLSQPLLLGLVVTSFRVRGVGKNAQIFRQTARISLPFMAWQLFGLLADAIGREMTPTATPYKPAPSSAAAIVFLRTPGYSDVVSLTDFKILHFRQSLIGTASIVGMECALSFILWQRCSSKQVGVIHPVNAERHDRVRFISCLLLSAAALFRTLQFIVHSAALLSTTKDNLVSMDPAQGLLFMTTLFEAALIDAFAIAAVR